MVVDANWLRNDIRYACLNDRRTTLVNVANEGLLRLFCSQHVIDAVAEHASEWTVGSLVSPDSFLHHWLMEYLPLLHVLQEFDVPPGLLTPDEVERIEVLRAADADDIPSVTLALILGALYLSEDRPALRAVYGSDADLWRQGQLLELLRAGGDAGQLGEILQLITGLIGGLGAAGVKGAWQRLGPAGLLVVAGIVFMGSRRVSTETKAKLRSGLTAGLTAFCEVYSEWQSHLRRFGAASPNLPSWQEIAGTNLSTDVLTRACFFNLARAGAEQLLFRRTEVPPSGSASPTRRDEGSTDAPNWYLFLRSVGGALAGRSDGRTDCSTSDPECPGSAAYLWNARLTREVKSNHYLETIGTAGASPRSMSTRSDSKS